MVQLQRGDNPEAKGAKAQAELILELELRLQNKHIELQKIDMPKTEIELDYKGISATDFFCPSLTGI